MLGALNQVAIAVPDIEAAARRFEEMLGVKASPPKPQPAHGVTVVFIKLPNTVIELITPLGENSPIRNFLERNPKGGIHHIGFDVGDIYDARDTLKAKGVSFTGDGEPKIGGHDNPVVFIHPKEFFGTLIELEQPGGTLR